MQLRILRLASTRRIELLSTVLETVAQPLYHVLMVRTMGFAPIRLSATASKAALSAVPASPQRWWRRADSSRHL